MELQNLIHMGRAVGAEIVKLELKTEGCSLCGFGQRR